MEKKETKKKKRKVGKKFFSTMIILFSVSLVLLVISLLVSFSLIENPLELLNREQQTFIIKDDCSLIVGQLIHTIGDEDSCKIKCRAECESRDLDIINSEFIEIESNCNRCDCNCK